MVRGVLLLSMSVAAFAQRPSPGLMVGVPVSAVCESESLGRFGSANVCTRRYVVGPSVEAKLPGALSLDFAALFTPVRMQGGSRAAAGYPAFSTQRSGTSLGVPDTPEVPAAAPACLAFPGDRTGLSARIIRRAKHDHHGIRCTIAR
jgi:hypothetical protein